MKKTIISAFMQYFYNLVTLFDSTSIFWFCALAGSGMFIIQFLLSLLGASDQEGFAMAEAADSANQFDGGTDSNDAIKFKRISLQTITGFLMMFGWTAITCQSEFSMQYGATIAISITSGLFTALMIAQIYRLAKSLQSPGSSFKVEDAIGKEATIYQQIPKAGVGKVSVTLEQFTYEIDAIASDQKELPSFIPVKIIKKFNDTTVVVSPIEQVNND